MVEDAKLLDLMRAAPDLETAVSNLIEAANAAGGTRQHHRARPAVRQLTEDQHFPKRGDEI